MSGDGFFARVYALVRSIPRGRVLTYGQVAALVGTARGARAVGWALRALDEKGAARVPWHRVVAAGGRISPRAGAGPAIQRRRLVQEGVRFRDGRVDFDAHGALAAARPVPTSRRPRRSSR
jgi:methylated-DNA-protein-cysteine methyltransferase-like protein